MSIAALRGCEDVACLGHTRLDKSLLIGISLVSLVVGKKLGVFEISGLLGVGGMGEVYRARDTKLGRSVAIKILPNQFASDRDRLARFQREARLLAALNHPNIAHLHDLLEADGQHYLVMELVEGQTLADRIRDGALPLAEIYKLFGQIAEGLEAAHQQGVIHRDLKPANVKITDDGKVSVLDFGLAKAAEAQSASSGAEATSPWNADGAATSCDGQLLGTPAYMSPEQARGKPVDKRTDIWAFGCCLYEALTGCRPFQGETVSDTLAKILTAEPDWNALPESTPPRLRELLQRCLAKDLRSRLCDIGDARLELSQIASNPGTASSAAALPAGVIGIRRSRLVAATIAGLLVASLAAGVAVWSVMRPVKNPQGVVRLTMELPPESAIGIDPTDIRSAALSRIALSPDGSRLVYAGGKEGETKLYLRRMEESEPTELKGTEGAASPFFSPDSQWVGFYARRKLKKIRLGESQPIVVCDAEYLKGASWGPDGMIYFAGSAGSLSNGGLKRVHESGGDPKLITDIEDNSNVIGHTFPCALPDGKSVLFTRFSAVFNNSSTAILNLETRNIEEVLPRSRFARYVRTGHLLFYDQGWYCAARFDPDRLKVVGPRIRIVQSSFIPAVSETGCLVHGPSLPWNPRDGVPNKRPLVWVDRHGETQRLDFPPEAYRDLRLSPDGKRLAVEVVGEQSADIWIYDFERKKPMRILSEGLSTFPVWTPDGKHVIFASSREGNSPANLYWAPADESAKPQPLTHSDRGQYPFSVSPDGRILAFIQSRLSSGYDYDIHTLPLNDPGAAKPLLQTEVSKGYPSFSPDGHWLAYVSDETATGQREVFVLPYPPTATSAPQQISVSGGGKPLWSKKGDELFYRNGPRLYSVPIQTEPAFKAGDPRLFLDKRFGDMPTRRGYDISPDGERFLFMELTAEEAAQGPVHQLIVVQNWFEELNRLAPANSK